MLQIFLDALLDCPRLNFSGGLARFKNLEHFLGVLGGFGFGREILMTAPNGFQIQDETIAIFTPTDA